MKKTIALTICLACCHLIAAQPSFTLQQLKDSALQNNLAVRTARLNIAAAQQQRKEAFTKYFPNVSAIGAWFNADKGMAKMEVDPQQMISPSLAASLAQMLPAEALAALSSPVSLSMMKHGTIAGLTALQPVFMGGQIMNGNRLARVGEEAAALQLRLSEQEVEKQTEQYYWQLVSLQEKMNTVAAVDTLLSDIHKDVEVAVRAGVVLRNDLLQVQLRQNDVESQRVKLQNGIGIVGLLLTQFCGLSATDCLQVTVDTLPPTLNSQLSTLNSQHSTLNSQRSTLNSQHLTLNSQPSTLRSLPEYQLLEKQVEATRLEKKMAVGQQLPTVAVGAGYNYHTLMENDRSFGMVFATVSVPISDWWGGSHTVRRKRIAQQQAEEQLADNAELLLIRMRNAYNNVVEAQQQLQIAQRGIEQAEENLRLHRDYYRAGTATMSDLLEAQLLYQQTLDRHTDALADLHLRLLDYRQATAQ